MNNCISLSSISALANCVDTDNRASIVNYVLIGFADEVGVWPNMPYGSVQNPLTLEQAGQWSGDLAMKNGCQLYKLAFTDETGEFKITEQGEKGSKSYLYEIDLTRAKMTQEMFGLENAVKERKLVILVRDRNGFWYLMGDQITPAVMTDGDGSTTGKGGAELNRTALKFQYSCPRKLVYAGEIDSLIKAADESNIPDQPVVPDYSDTDKYTILDIGSQVHSTGVDDYHLYFPVENNSQEDDIYETLNGIVAQGKTPVLRATLVYGNNNTVVEIALSRLEGADNFLGTSFTEEGYYVSVKIEPIIALSTIYLEIE